MDTAQYWEADGTSGSGIRSEEKEERMKMYTYL